MAKLADILARFRGETQKDLPPFQGGAAGLLSYDLRHCFECVPSHRWDEFQVPSLAVGLYDVVLAFDHQEDRAWLISQGFPETESRKRGERAAKRLHHFRAMLSSTCESTRSNTSGVKRVFANKLAPQFETSHRHLTSDFSAEGYCRTVGRAIDYIYAGDVFQVNLSQRLLQPSSVSSARLYQRLRERNPAPFAAYFDSGDFQILSASPERFMRVAGGQVETRPIKGTCPRTTLPEADLFAGSGLVASEKDRAENVMIVDLLRNDLSRVCLPETVFVEQLCQLEVYAYVQHLVSSVVGTLAPGRSALDLIAASFPGGSITGAPKVRAMEIIAELEPTARGAYCGGLGYLGFDGALDMNILIRTITAGRGWWQLPVGGGIVAQSKPKDEYEETWHKAEGLLRALHK